MQQGGEGRLRSWTATDGQSGLAGSTVQLTLFRVAPLCQASCGVPLLCLSETPWWGCPWEEAAPQLAGQGSDSAEGRAFHLTVCYLGSPSSGMAQRPAEAVPSVQTA